jgi:hypothetical protein
MSAKELYWDSKENPSEVKGIFDLREATIGRATFKEVRFQDVVDFSRANFCPELLGPLTKDQLEAGQQSLSLCYPSPGVHLENNTFEKEVDLLHVTFGSSALLINNRFRSTLDLTGASFTTPNANLCLSFNRISRLVLGPENLGRPPTFSPFDQFRSLFGTSPLQKSRIRYIAFKKTSAPVNNVASQCGTLYQQDTTTGSTIPQVENLDVIYKTLGNSFREANDQGGLNEAWYLQTVAKRNHTATIWDTIWDWISWGLGDIPSRYTVDIWRTVWISIVIMLGFYVCYVWVLWRLVRSNDPDDHQLQVPAYPAKQRAFRIRLFEPIHISRKTTDGQEASTMHCGRFPCQRNHRVTKMPGYQAISVSGHHSTNVQDTAQDTRRIIPWRDAAGLSFRAFTKIGLGTSYPHTRCLKVLTSIEWVLGVYMLIHFSIAVKNNLPFIAPFLGVVN